MVQALRASPRVRMRTVAENLRLSFHSRPHSRPQSSSLLRMTDREKSRYRRQSRDKRQGLCGRECRAPVAVSHVIKDKGSGVENVIFRSTRGIMNGVLTVICVISRHLSKGTIERLSYLPIAGSCLRSTELL